MLICFNLPYYYICIGQILYYNDVHHNTNGCFDLQTSELNECLLETNVNRGWLARANSERDIAKKEVSFIFYINTAVVSGRSSKLK